MVRQGKRQRGSLEVRATRSRAGQTAYSRVRGQLIADNRERAAARG